jgi:pimeloyl-ACP methyl ester carboxylesterase
MNDTKPCNQPCLLSCEDVCAVHGQAALTPIELDDARARFARDAVRSTCDTGRYRMPYYVWGEGPPLLFIHGVSDTSHSFLLTISRLSANFRCVAYDLPGSLGDGARLSSYTHADLVRDVWALLDHLGVRQSYVVGSSFGSTIALMALRERPERLPRAVLQGGLARRPLRGGERIIARVGRYVPGTMARVPLREKMIAKVHSFAFVNRPFAVWKYFLKCTGRTPIRTFAYQALWLDKVDLRPILPDVKQPVLLLCGERDPLIGRAHEEVLLAGLPNAGRVLVEGCGHTPSYTHPEVFAEVVRQFLTPPPSAVVTRSSSEGGNWS